MSAAGLQRLNRLPAEAARQELLTCCGSRAWAKLLAIRRPFPDEEALLAAADEVWWSLSPDDWLEAFRAHPRIGERQAEAGQTEREQAWSAREQAGVAAAAEETRAALARGNREYEERFGHIYIVCAAGRSAAELLDTLRSRLTNEPAAELRVAAEEQRKITRLRLSKLLDQEEG